MINKPRPLLPITAMLLQCSDLDDDASQEHLGDEPFDPWHDGPPAGLADDLRADRDHWHSEAMRYKAGLVELHASIRELRAALDASQEALDGMDRACEWADWRKLWNEVLKNTLENTRSFAEQMRNRYKRLLHFLQGRT